MGNALIHRVRCAERQDAEGVLAIYAPIVQEAAISFELEPPSLKQMRERIESTIQRFPWLVCESERGIDGYAYASNNPVKYTDPTGHCPLCVIVVLAGFAISMSQIPSDIPHSDPAEQGNQDVFVGGLAIAGGSHEIVALAGEGAMALARLINNGELWDAGMRVYNSATGATVASGLSNVDARKWYLDQEARIQDQLDPSLPLEEQAKQAFELRNLYRTQARDLMADRDLAQRLAAEEPNLTWEQVVQKAENKGLSGDGIYRYIIESSQRSRQSVNIQLGINKPR